MEGYFFEKFLKIDGSLNSPGEQLAFKKMRVYSKH